MTIHVQPFPASSQSSIGFGVEAPTWPPNYTAIFAWRQQRILVLRASPFMLLGAKEYYRTHPIEFIEHWCNTYDPRNAGKLDANGMEKPTTMPFILFKRQKDLVVFLQSCLGLETNGLIEKCRDMGATWLCAAFSVWLWLFLPGAAIGWGSRKQEYVDELGMPDSILEKIRILIRGLPPEFLPAGFSVKDHMPFMRILNPETGSSISGEIGDNIGRGGRKLIYFKDESAHYVHPEMVEAALGDNTRVQIDISSVNGLGNVFHRRRKNGIDFVPYLPMVPKKTAVFVMDWRDHPEKDQKWYDERRTTAIAEGLEHKFAQEVDRDYSSSLQGIIIKAIWVKAAIDAHLPRVRANGSRWEGFDDEGPRVGALDVADEGGDLNALAVRKGPILRLCEAWGDGDTGKTARRAVVKAASFGPMDLQYDSVGVGAGVKAETNRLITDKKMPAGIRMVPWSAGAKCLHPERRLILGDKQSPLNKDYFQNIKSQGWFQLARRFERTYRAIVEGVEYDPGELISIPSDLEGRDLLEAELSQVTQGLSTQTLKMIVEKAPEGTKSPNRADSVMMAYWPTNSQAFKYGKDVVG